METKQEDPPMSPVVKIQTYSELPENQKQEMYKLRHKVFIDRLKWDLDSTDQLEKDQYDTTEASYALVYIFGELAACWRLIPTNKTYMFVDTFPNLLEGEKYHSPKIIELSRFAVDKDLARRVPHVNLMALLFYHVTEYALHNQIKEYITLTTVQVERIVKSLGIPLGRIGNGEVHRIDNTRSVALKIPVGVELKKWFVNAPIYKHGLDRAS